MRSFRRYGFRMIGGTAAIARARRRAMGDSNEPAGFLFGSSSGPANPAQYGGEFPAPAATHVVALHVGVPAAAHPLLTTAPAVMPTRSAFVPTPTASAPDCPSCGLCLNPVVVGAASALGSGLLMYFVGLASKERKVRRRAA
jgi:hypothetical protein